MFCPGMFCPAPKKYIYDNELRQTRKHVSNKLAFLEKTEFCCMRVSSGDKVFKTFRQIIILKNNNNN